MSEAGISGVATRRDQLLLKMYDQMYGDINRHILVVWQCVSVLIGAFAIFALAEKHVITIDLASAILILLCGWLFAHLLDAGYWYNRNLAIIANIERQFLRKRDLHEIHYYFGKHRDNNRMLTHLRIQFKLGSGIAILVLLFHFLTRVLPGFPLPWSSFEPMRALPYLILIPLAVVLMRLNGNRDNSLKEFLKNSPGVDVDASGVEYGVGHGVDLPPTATPNDSSPGGSL